FFAGRFFAVDFFRAVLFLAVDFRAVDFLAVDFLAVDFLAVRFFAGRFLTAFRALEAAFLTGLTSPPFVNAFLSVLPLKTSSSLTTSASFATRSTSSDLFNCCLL